MPKQARADELTLRSIHSLLNGNEWDGETLAEIAKHIEAAGFHIAEVNEPRPHLLTVRQLPGMASALSERRNDQAKADELTLRNIHSLLNGNEWDGETLAEIAKHIEEAGFYIAEINEASSPDREATPGHGECACRECAIREVAARDYVRYPLHGRP